MEIIRTDRNSNYEEYEQLVLKKEVVQKEAGAAMGAYILEFGELITTAFQKKIDCIAKKKSITFCQRLVNRGKKINLMEMQAHLEKEMAEYHKELHTMLEQYEECKNAEPNMQAEVIRARAIYRQIAKRIHPDINMKAQEIPEIQELWRRAQIAYKLNKADDLKEIQVVMEIMLEDSGLGRQTVEVPDIEEKIQVLKEEIDHIMSTDPYRYIALLADEEAVAEVKRQLEKEIAEYTEYEKELDEILQSLIDREGAVLVWQMNYQ